jgi:hypothetical protein
MMRFRTGTARAAGAALLVLCGAASGEATGAAMAADAAQDTAASLPSGAAKQLAMIPTASVDDLSADAKQVIKDHFRKNFMLPDIVLWKFDYLRAYPTGGTAVCGRVNFPNSTRQYVGYKPFYALFQHGDLTGSVIVAREEADPERASPKSYNIACGQAVP